MTFDMKCRLSFLQSQFFNQSLNAIPFTYDYDIVWSFICWYKNILLCRSDRHAFTSTFCNTLPVGCLKFCFSLEIRSSIWSFTISFQDDRTESSTISRLAHCNAYWSTASHKNDKFLSQSTLHGSLYFRHLQSDLSIWNLVMIERSPVITWPYGSYKWLEVLHSHGEGLL